MNHDTHDLSAVIELYFDKRRSEKPATKQWRATAWEHLINALGDGNITEIGYADIEDYEAYLFGQGLAQNAVRSYMKAVSKVFGWSERRGLRDGNPFNGYTLPRRIEYEIRTYSDAELCDLQAAATTMRWRALLRTAESAGLRRGEALNLRVQDVDFERNTISIQPHKPSNDTWPWRPKYDKNRMLPLATELSDLFCSLLTDEIPAGQPYLLLTEEQYWLRKKQYQAGTLKDRNRLTPDNGFDSAFTRLRRRAGIQGTYHDLRRTCLSKWSRMQGIGPADLHKLAGHANIETTMRYYLGVRADVLDLLQNQSVGVTGYEPATSGSPNQRSNQAELHPDNKFSS